MRKFLTRRNEKGATMVEAAIVSTLLVLLLTCIFGGALYIRSYVALNSAADAGARAGTASGASTDADYQILQAVSKHLSSMSNKQVQRIIVYKAASPSDPVPSVCETATPGNASQTGLCNVYTSADFAKTSSNFIDPSWYAAHTWDPMTRKDSRTMGSDYIGVQITADCGCAFTGAKLSTTIKKKTVLRIESRQN